MDSSNAFCLSISACWSEFALRFCWRACSLAVHSFSKRGCWLLKAVTSFSYLLMRLCEERIACRSAMMDWLCSNMGSRGACFCRYPSTWTSSCCCSFLCFSSQAYPLQRRMNSVSRLFLSSSACCSSVLLLRKEANRLRASEVRCQSFISRSFCRKSSDSSKAFFSSHAFFWFSASSVSSAFFFSHSCLRRAMSF